MQYLADLNAFLEQHGFWFCGLYEPFRWGRSQAVRRLCQRTVRQSGLSRSVDVSRALPSESACHSGFGPTRGPSRKYRASGGREPHNFTRVVPLRADIDLHRDRHGHRSGRRQVRSSKCEVRASDGDYVLDGHAPASCSISAEDLS